MEQILIRVTSYGANLLKTVVSTLKLLYSNSKKRNDVLIDKSR